MDSQYIKEMVRALGPVLKDKQKASDILKRYWQDKIAIVWTIQQVHRAANECKVALTKQEAIQLLQQLQHKHNPQYGLRWSNVTDYIKDQVLGRELTNAELKRFIEEDVVTIQKQSRGSKHRYTV